MSEVCYVCKKKIVEVREVAPRRVLYLASEKSQVHHITSPVYVGRGLYRHHRCEPGGVRWMEVQKAKRASHRSALYWYFLQGRQDEKD
jgi:hypothetical protein